MRPKPERNSCEPGSFKINTDNQKIGFFSADTGRRIGHTRCIMRTPEETWCGQLLEPNDPPQFEDVQDAISQRTLDMHVCPGCAETIEAALQLASGRG